MAYILLLFNLVIILSSIQCIIQKPASVTAPDTNDLKAPPEGYYNFIESPNAEPPQVRPPPYKDIDKDCVNAKTKPYPTAYNLCGDLNKGFIPRNPMGQNVHGQRYPFELIRNHTLKFLSRTLPILKADNTLPKVTEIQAAVDGEQNAYNNLSSNRVKRDLTNSTPKSEPASSPNTSENAEEPIKPNRTENSENVDEASTGRSGRKFCDQGGFWCSIYKAINGDGVAKSSPGGHSHFVAADRQDNIPLPAHPRYEGPPTPCPAKVEYATPVFAKNYQGTWRYIVQIPYEGYFTQTIEVTRCLQSKCHYLDGGCLSSPRWTSLLVAEIYYPDIVLNEAESTSPQRDPVFGSSPPPVQDFNAYQQYLQKRAGVQAGYEIGVQGAYEMTTSTTTAKPQHCDGYDKLGCFQVRLYYDWFLIPGSCKCWRPDYFNKYVRRNDFAEL